MKTQQNLATADVPPIRYFTALYHDKKDLWYYETPTGRSRWHNKEGECNTHAKLAEGECQRRGWVLRSKSDEADSSALQNCELIEAWHLMNVLSANLMDEGPTWPRVLEWLARNEAYRPANIVSSAPDKP